MVDEEVRSVNPVPIGRFSKMTRLSVTALRLYDEIGLLTPARVDASSGYRYYELGHAGRAEAVMILRSVDMPSTRSGQFSTQTTLTLPTSICRSIESGSPNVS